MEHNDKIITCPACDGFGTKKSKNDIINCHGCDGKTYIIVGNDKRSICCPKCNGFGTLRHFSTTCDICEGKAVLVI